MKDKLTVKPMYLHEIPKESKIFATLDTGQDCFITFHHLDGMYSYCTIDGDGRPLHLYRFQELKQVGSHYELVDNPVAEEKIGV